MADEKLPESPGNRRSLAVSDSIIYILHIYISMYMAKMKSCQRMEWIPMQILANVELMNISKQFNFVASISSWHINSGV